MKLLVYGTLKKGHCNHSILKGATYLGEGTTAPAFTMLHLGGFPGVIPVGETAIHGEVYELPTGKEGVAMRDRLDRLEGHPSFYERLPIEVTMDGQLIPVETYLLPPSWLTQNRHSTVASGIWGR